MKTLSYEELVGKTCILCAVDGFKFRLGDLTFEAIEDEDDGYRSCLSHFSIVENIRTSFQEHCFIDSNDPNVEGIVVINDKGKVILKVGTSSGDPYYPTFEFHFYPENLTCNQSQFDIDKLINSVTED